VVEEVQHDRFLVDASIGAFRGSCFSPTNQHALAGEKQVITVHKDPTCSCCSGWVQHLQQAGFDTKVLDTRDLDAVKKRLGVPDDLAACHTAEVAGYIIEGTCPPQR